jgi:Mrp family chromosome partitioning ATPase
LLTELVDGFVLVARAGSTPQPLLAEALSRLTALDALFLGTVLNRCEPISTRLSALGNSTPARIIRAIGGTGGSHPAFDETANRTDAVSPDFSASARRRSL